jgi:predicted metalloprotease
MRWQMGRRSGNVEDRRGMGRGAAAGGGGLLAMALVVFLLGGDPTSLLVEGVQREIQYRGQPVNTEAQAEQMDFVSSVLGSTEDVWIQKYPGEYVYPTLVVYSGVVESGCGMGQSAMGPFYCPNDQNLYLDLSFFEDLEKQLNAPGDFARAYVIAHEVGHHVQTLMGTADKVRAAQARANRKDANALSVKMELQADCYAGIWAHDANAKYDLVEEGDIEEALNAATQIGDDRLQQRGQGQVVPDSFTHGSSAQRYEWFQRGFESGDVSACDTFSARL